jgi:predicted  nucleic acid-binding Zn-ribbon protein
MFFCRYRVLSPSTPEVCYYPLPVIEYDGDKMAITRQLYQLQELDTLIEQEEASLAMKTAQLGKRDVLDDLQDKLTTTQQHLKELNKKRHDAEWEVDDLLSKITTAESQLYGGKITNPKELSSLQHEVNTMKERNDQLETNALEAIDQVENAEREVAALTDNYRKLEGEWLLQQKQLTEDIAKLKASLTDLNRQRGQLAAQIDESTINLYERIRQEKKQAVAKVEQGICRACRISLSASVLQKARSGQPVQCGTCGRILFIS